ncbi:MAG TPA: hypothetical protein VIL71_00255 [Spirillospora sp.]
MDDLGFFVDLVTTGTVLGLDHTSDLATVEEVLGTGRTFPVSRSGDVLVSDFGLVEFGWRRSPARGGWEVTYYGAQTHRLRWLADEGGIEPPLLERYGPFRRLLDVGELDAAVRARGFALERVPAANPDCDEYRQPDSGLEVVALSAPDEDSWGPKGTVIKMLSGGDTAGRAAAWRRFRGREQAFRGYAEHLLNLPEADRNAWLDEREPPAGPERADWWACLRSTAGRRARGGSRDAARWWRLALALDRHAVERGVDSEDRAAVALATAVLDAADAGVAGGLPTIDEAVARWLEAVPAPLDRARRLCVERPLDADGVRLSRRLRDQIHAVEPCLARVSSPEVAAGLRAWTDLKPELLRLPVR